MAREHGGDLYDLSTMSDAELRELVLQQLDEHGEIDETAIDVNVKNGHVTLTGRVGTDEEVQIAEAILDDVIGVEDYSNELIVDENYRAEAPEAADEAAVAAAEAGEPSLQQTDTAEHLVENIESETYGTHDMGEAIRDGSPYIPPERPTGDGYDSRENH